MARVIKVEKIRQFRVMGLKFSEIEEILCLPKESASAMLHNSVCRGYITDPFWASVKYKVKNIPAALMV